MKYHDQDYATAVLIITPQGIPLVRDPKKPRPWYWKLPGGRSVGNETAQRCAVREVGEELGILLKEEDLQTVREEVRNTHILVVFRVDLPELSGMSPHGDEGEEIKVFSAREILMLSDFFPNHRRLIATVLETVLS